MSALPEEMKRRVFVLMRRFKQEQYLPLTAPEGATPAEANAIIAIYMSGKAGIKPIQPHMIARGLHQTPSAVSQTLKGLEEKGFIKRERMSDDSRAVSLELTESGIWLAKEVDRIREELIGDLLAYIGQEDADHLLSTLEKILDFHKEQAEAGKMKRVQFQCEGPPGSQSDSCVPKEAPGENL